MPCNEMTQEYACSLFDYKDGVLFWKINKTTRNLIGKPVGSPMNGYKSVMVDGKNWRIHRLVFLMHNGYLPSTLDHINGDRSDNRIENLREATASQNAHNQKMRPDNKTGVKGVSWNKDRGKWVVRVNHLKKNYQRYVDNFELAELIAVEMRNKYHGSFANHGAQYV